MAEEGPNSPGTMADDDTVGTVAWTSPDNAKVSDNVYASAVLVSQTTHYLRATNFGFSIPTDATIDSIVVEIEKKCSSGTTDGRVRLIKNGTILGTAVSFVTYTTTENYDKYPTSGNYLWGATWTAEDINDIDFGLVTDVNIGSTNTLSVDHIRITVYYTEVSGVGGIMVKAKSS